MGGTHSGAVVICSIVLHHRALYLNTSFWSGLACSIRSQKRMMCANTKFSLFFLGPGLEPPRAHPGCRNTDFSMFFFIGPGLDSPLCAGMAVGYFSWPACDGREP